MITKDINGANISNAFVTAVEQDTRRFLAKILLNGVELDCAIRSLEITKGSCGGEEFGVGAVIANRITAELQDLTTTLKGNDITAQIGVEVSENTYEWVQLGAFTVTDAKKTPYLTTITGYGYSVTRTSGAFTPPLTPTIANIAAEIATETGCTVTLDAGATEQITAPLTGLTTYGALQVLASVVGGYVVDTYDGNIAIHTYSGTATVAKNAGMCKLLPDLEETNFTVTGVRVVVSEESTDDEGNVIPAVQYESGNEINLDIGNPYMTAELFATFAQNVVGYSYRAGDIDLSLGDPRIEGNDVVAITNIDGNVYNVPCHSVTHTYDGGFRTKISAIRPTREADDIATPPPISSRITHVERTVVTAQTTAAQAKQIAGDTNQYFWFTGTGTDTGAHITEVPQDDFTDPTSADYHSGGNLLARSNGIAVRDGLQELATFGANGIQIGQQAETNIGITRYAMKQTGINGDTVLFVGSTNNNNGEATYMLRVFTTKTAIITNRKVNLGEAFTAINITNATYLVGLVRHDITPTLGTDYTFTSGNDYFNVVSGGAFDAISSTTSAVCIDIEVTTTEEIMTLSCGDGAEATAPNSVAVGHNTKASYFGAFASGDGSEANGIDTVAMGQHCIASGNFSAAFGSYTQADGSIEFVCGVMNEPTDANGVALYGWSPVFIMGNGANAVRNNGFVVTFGGDIFFQCNKNEATGDTDRDAVLQNAIAAIGWTSDCIVSSIERYTT